MDLYGSLWIWICSNPIVLGPSHSKSSSQTGRPWISPQTGPWMSPFLDPGLRIPSFPQESQLLGAHGRAVGMETWNCVDEAHGAPHREGWKQKLHGNCMVKYGETTWKKHEKKTSQCSSLRPGGIWQRATSTASTVQVRRFGPVGDLERSVVFGTLVISCDKL